MVFNLVPWLLKGSDRPEYALKQADSLGAGMVEDVDVFAGFLLAIVAVRLVFNYLLSSTANRLAAQHGRDAAHKDGSKLLEELWVFLGNCGMLGSAMYVMLYRNGDCWFANTVSCMAGWPDHPVDPAVALYYSMELAWYTHLLLKPVLRYGLPDGRDMMAHHVASLALLLLSGGLGMARIGIVVLTLFGISNPFLHFAKICNQLNMRIKMPAFALFALLFLVTRVLMVPPVILIPTLVDSRSMLPFAVADFFPAYLIFNVLLVVLYSLQLMWMMSIYRVLVKAATVGADAASKLSAKIDPAKRFEVESPRGEGPGAAANGKQD